MTRCIFCLEEKEPLTDEHIIPAALGSNVVLKKSVCEDCQRQCNRSFEQRFLKGSNFIALLRAHLGIRGRRNTPIFGFDQHGHPLTLVVQPGFPPIRVGLRENGLERPMQVIVADESRNPLDYYFLPDKIQRPILPSFFDGIVESVSPEAKFASFWADGDSIAANAWRELLEAFVAWSNLRTLIPIASSVAAREAQVPFSLDWNTEYRNRGLAKICFLYLISMLPYSDRFNEAFQSIRDYILFGKNTAEMQTLELVIQWNGPHPEVALGDRNFTYLLATVEVDRRVFGVVQLHNMGLFCVRLLASQPNTCPPDSLTTYLLQKEGSDNYALTTHDHSSDEVAAFAASIRRNGQLSMKV
ncbi:MAG: HNH endonuclease [bacterium]